MSHDHDDHAVDPIPGLPELPPRGELILWQGAPHWTTVAIRAFHIRKVIIYLLIFVALRASLTYGETGSVTAALDSILFVFTLALTAVGLFLTLAWAIARVTVYTITNRRIVMRFGVAVQMTTNLPFALIEAASVKLYKDGTGDIPLKLRKDERISYIVFWPHVRPWRFLTPQPMLRGVPNARRVAEILGQAMQGNSSKAAVFQEHENTSTESTPAG